MIKKFFLFIFLLPIYIFSHDLQHKLIEHKEIVEVILFYPDNTKFSFESYEIYSPENEKIPFQVGRTDKYGRIFFNPDKEGEWKINTTSSDGHGKRISLNLKGRKLEEKNLSLYDRFGKIITGVSILFGIFGILSLIYRRKR